MNSPFGLYLTLTKKLSTPKLRQLRITAFCAIFCSCMEVLPLIFLPLIFGDRNNNVSSLAAPFVNSQSQAVILFCITTIISIACRYIYYILSQRISIYVANEFQTKALSNLVDKGYISVSTQNNAELLDLLTNQVNLVGVSVNYLLIFISGCSTTLIFSIALLVFDIRSTLALILIISSSYISANLLVKPIINRNSKTKLKMSFDRASKIESIRSMYRELSLEGLLNLHRADLSNIDLKVRQLQFQDQALGIFPKYLIEGIAIIALLVISFINYNQGGSVMLTLVAYVFSMQRLLPSAQQIFSSKSEINSYSYPLMTISKMIDGNSPVHFPVGNVSIDEPKLKFSHLSLEDVSFAHGENLLIKDLSLVVNQGEWLAICGPTGSGKSTLMNLMMGFIHQDSGEVSFNSEKISVSSNLSYWHNIISFVPQEPYLYDSSILFNITYKHNLDEVDLDKLNRAISTSCISDFCGFDSLEIMQCSYNGSSLSGGQRQRVSIARSLYADKSILFLDEFTSALDELTEFEIIKNLKFYYPQLTVIMVSHRRQPLQACTSTIFMPKT